MPPPRPAAPQDGHAEVLWPQPSRRGWIQAAALHPNPGLPPLHRLNRTEYGYAIRDLLLLNVDASSLLPPDAMSHGFDNMADVLTTSPFRP